MNPILEKGVSDRVGLMINHCWQVQIYGSMFSMSDGGHMRYLRPLTRTQLSDNFRAENVELFGLMVFLLPMYGQQVNQPCTVSTLALATGCIPEEWDRSGIDKYKSDYRAIKPSHWIAIKSLVATKDAEQQAPARESVLGDIELSDIIVPVSRLKVGSSPEDTKFFSEKASTLMRTQILEHVFRSPQHTAQTLRVGFQFPMASCTPSSAPISKEVGKSISMTLSQIVPENIEGIFGAETGVDAESFYKMCHFQNMGEDERDRFKRVLTNMTHLQRYKLNKFITDSDFFAYEPITIVGGPSTWKDDRLPEASTCFRTMTIPRYTCDDMMATKLNYACVHTEYGNA